MVTTVVEEHPEEDCGYSSGDEDGLERLQQSAPNKRPVEEEWEDCQINID